MSKQRQVSGIAIALLMMGLVIGVGSCYATEPEDLPWSNETDVFILPWNNETTVEERLDNIEKVLAEMRDVVDDIKYGLFGARVISRPSMTPDPVTNETDVVIIVTDPLEELSLRIDYLDTSLQDLTEEFSILQAAYGAHATKANKEIGYLKNDIQTLIFKQSKLQTNIQYVYFAIAIVVIVIIFSGWAITRDLMAKVKKTP